MYIACLHSGFVNQFMSTATFSLTVNNDGVIYTLHVSFSVSKFGNYLKWENIFDNQQKKVKNKKKNKQRWYFFQTLLLSINVAGNIVIRKP